MKKLSKILLISSMAVLLVVGSASATAYLRLDDGTNSLTIYDNDVNDTEDATDGLISYSGAFYSWTVDVTGTSKPAIGDLWTPVMDVNASATGVGTLYVTFTEDDYEHLANDDSVAYSMSFDGTAGGQVQWNGYWDPGNFVFAEAELLGSTGPLTADYLGVFSGDLDFTGDNDVGASMYALTLVGEFTPGSSVPEPATMLLLGSGLIGLVGFRRKFKK